MKPNELAEKIAREIIKARRERLNTCIAEVAKKSGLRKSQIATMRAKATEAIDSGDLVI